MTKTKIPLRHIHTGISDGYLKIKRGDSLTRNVRNIEIDVKCRKFYIPKNSKEKCFDFSAEHLIKHQDMYHFTQAPIVMALCQRDYCFIVYKND